MAISFNKYVSIVSGIGAGATVRQRDLIGRLFTDSNLVPPGTMLDFTSAADVGTYFGTSSEEYARAVFYFAWISKNITRVQKITFARWVDAAVAPRVYGVSATYTLANFTSVSAGSIGITMGVSTTQLTAIDLSAATSLADVAAAMQTKIRAYTAGGAVFTAATVTYDATRKSFNLVGGATGAAPMAITVGGTGTDLSSRLGWLAGSIQATGSAAVSITDTLQASADASSNFGSFLFMPTLSIDEVVEAATWNNAQNISFQYMVPVASTDTTAYHTALKNLGGTAVTLSVTSGEYPEMVPMMIMAATNYQAQNSVQNYMFQQFNLTPSVTTTTLSNSLDTLRINYYGRTQTNGQLIDFYQRGLLMGLATSPSDQNVYANEQWLKDFIGTQIMTLLLSLARVPANAQGVSQLQAIIQASVTSALTNGTISVGKPLTPTQQLFITEQSGSDKAWYQVQNIGYYLTVKILSVAVDDRTEWKATYTLIYSKDDAVRKVEGQDILI